MFPSPYCYISSIKECPHSNIYLYSAEDLTHDLSFVYKVMEAAVESIKTRLIPDIKTISNYSDGCAGQYKNQKHFYNIHFHASDFSVDCELNFFATSHGKLPVMR